jgi:hypothetical protein
MRRLTIVAAVSGIYDLTVGVALVAGRDLLARLFGVPHPVPAIHADLNGLFLLAIAAGYILPYRNPQKYRGYLWVMGPLLKGAGAATFVLDYVFRGSPASYLIFAFGDGTLALLTLWALLKE